MKINNITTIVDLAFNLSGSLAGLPAILSQLPVNERIGFAALPKVWEDTLSVGQTWTPELAGLDLSLRVESYNALAINKAPYSSNKGYLKIATDLGNALLPVLVWDENLQRGDIDRLTGQLISSDTRLRTVDFIPILGDTYALDSRGLFADAAMIVYDENYNYVDYWGLPANSYREVDVSNAAFFKVAIYSLSYEQGSIQIKPTNF